jgi:hypothetical protein
VSRIRAGLSGMNSADADDDVEVRDLSVYDRATGVA